jgi:fatty acid desaturase
VRYRREVIDALICTRTTLLSPPIAAIFAPYNVSFHIEHHMCPAVPAFNLRRLHELVASHADYQKHAHLTRGYVQLAAELTGRRASERAVPSSATRASTLSGRAQDR